MNEKKLNPFLTITVFALGTAMFYLYTEGIPLGSYTVMVKYLLAFVIVMLGVIAFLVTPDVEQAKRLASDALVLSLPYLLIIFLSLPLWVIQQSPLSHITRGGANIIYMLLGLAVAVSYIAMFGKRAPVVQMCSVMAANFILIFMQGIREFGLRVFISDYIELVRTLGEDKRASTMMLELTDLTFAIGLYLLYYLTKRGKLKFRIPIILVLLFLFLAGLKRIALGAIVLGVIIALLGRIMPKEIGQKIFAILGYAIIIFAVIYIVAIKSNFFNLMVDILDIDTKGRNEIYEFLDGYYQFSPLFHGYGVGYGSRLLETEAPLSIRRALGFHNDYLRTYVEIGFFGYLAWLWLSWRFKISHFFKKRGYQAGVMIFVIYTYCFCTYMTDNNFYYFYTNLVTFTLALACSYGEDTKIT